MRAGRLRAIIWKEWQDYRHSWAPWLAALATLPVLVLPFLFSELLPAWSGEPLERSEYAVHMDRMQAAWPALGSLPPNDAVRAWIYHQFLLTVILVPITGAMSLAAYSLMGEKATRSLEPLLATPLTTKELLFAKTLGAALPSLLIEGGALAVYGMGMLTAGGWPLLRAVFTSSAAIVVFAVGPLATMVAIQLVTLGSVRASDPRSAQQTGVLLVLPLIGLVAAQSAGGLWMGPLAWLTVAGGLGVLWLLLFAACVALFAADVVLTR
ncbi:MAG: ABC transporter permease subunit [Vicinamibacterales bacterium]